MAITGNICTRVELKRQKPGVRKKSGTPRIAHSSWSGVSVLPEFLIREEMDKGLLVSLHKPEKLVLYLVER
ncbi:MAG TPA: hypothetical protein VGE46_02925 [Bdellovibrio sp.]